MTLAKLLSLLGWPDRRPEDYSDPRPQVLRDLGACLQCGGTRQTSVRMADDSVRRECATCGRLQ